MPAKPLEPEALAARLDAALGLLRDLHAMVRKQGGYSSTPQQAVMRKAHALLVERGYLVNGEELHAPSEPAWAENPPPWTCESMRHAGRHTPNNAGTECFACGAALTPPRSL
jgi:hypothetical protein